MGLVHSVATCGKPDVSNTYYDVTVPVTACNYNSSQSWYLGDYKYRHICTFNFAVFVSLNLYKTDMILNGYHSHFLQLIILQPLKETHIKVTSLEKWTPW